MDEWANITEEDISDMVEKLDIKFPNRKKIYHAVCIVPSTKFEEFFNND